MRYFRGYLRARACITIAMWVFSKKPFLVRKKCGYSPKSLFLFPLSNVWKYNIWIAAIKLLVFTAPYCH